MEELKADFQSALKGWEYWLDLKERYRFNEKDGLIICPSDNCLLNKVAMEKLNEFLIRKYIQRVVILSVVPEIESYYSRCDKVKAYFQQIGSANMYCLLKYYRLTQFTKNIVVISCEEPFGNRNIIGKKGITLSDYVRDAIYV